LRGSTVSEKLLKIPLFGPSLNHQLRLLGSQQHPRSGTELAVHEKFKLDNRCSNKKAQQLAIIKALEAIEKIDIS
jgi:hypothetical protein